MSLNWSAKDVKNWDELKKVDFFDNKLEIVVFDMMNVGINKITPANYKEFYRRQVFMRYARYDYKMVTDFTEVISEDFIERLIGLGSNASNKTITQFNKDILGDLEWKVKSLIEKSKEN